MARQRSARRVGRGRGCDHATADDLLRRGTRRGVYRFFPERPAGAVAIKQLYASHYFHTALDLSVCVRDTTDSGRRGFYLVTLKSSAQDGLTGVKGSALRKIVVDKSRSSLESALASIKQTVERSPKVE
jgi:hypothetical protein